MPLARHAPRELPARAVGPPHHAAKVCPEQRGAGSMEVSTGKGPRALPAAPSTGHGVGTPGACGPSGCRPIVCRCAWVSPRVPTVCQRGPLPRGSLTLADGILQQPLATRDLEGLGAEQAPGQGGQGQPTATLLFDLEVSHLGEQPDLLLQQPHERPVLLLQLHCGQGQMSTRGGPGDTGRAAGGRGRAEWRDSPS